MDEETEYDEMMLSNVITPMTRSVTLLTLQIMSLSKKKNARKTSDNNTHVLQNVFATCRHRTKLLILIQFLSSTEDLSYSLLNTSPFLVVLC